MRKKALARSARLGIFWCLFFFAVFQGGLALVLEYGWLSGRDPFYGPKAGNLKSRLAKKSGAGLVLMLGSSRTGDGFRGELIESSLEKELGRPMVAYNLGIPGSGPMAELLYLHRLLAEGVHPEFLLVEVLPSCLDYRGGANANWIPGERLSWSELKELKTFPAPRRRQVQEWREARLVPCYNQRFIILSNLVPDALPPLLQQTHAMHANANGWVPRGRSPTPAERKKCLELARREYAKLLETFHLGGPSCQALRHILDECRQRSIPVALVLMPEGDVFRSWYPPNTWRQIDVFLAGLRKEFNVPVVDARTWIAEEDFLDSHHLLPRGSARFSRRLMWEAILPGLRSEVASAVSADLRKPSAN